MEKETLESYRQVMSEIQSFKPTTGSFEAEGEEAIISGEAIGEGTWNRFYYPSKELKIATDTLIGVPLVIGHGKSDADEVGEVIDAQWNNDKEVIEFEAKVNNDKVSQMIKRGVVDSVSVGVEFEEENENGKKVARDLDFYELALVKEPAFVDGIHKIIDDEIPEDEQDKLNEMSMGGESEMAKNIDEMFENLEKDDKVIIDIPKEFYEDLSDKEDMNIVGRYPGPKGYYPGPGNSSYPYPSPRPRGTFNSILEIFNRLDQLADEVGLEFETKYPYPSLKENEEMSEDEARTEVLQVEVDVETAQGLLEDLQESVSMLVDEVGYPGPDTNVADVLEDINAKMEALADELGMELE